MKAIFLASTVALIAVTAPAGASVQTVGGSMARTCYLAADARDATSETITNCTRALTEQALSADDRVATHVNRGILRLIKNDFRSAESDFDRAIAMDATEPEAWLNKGIARYQQGDPAGALRMFEQAIQLRTRYEALAYYARGLANEDSGNVRAAYADLTRAKQLRPDWSAPAVELQRYQVRSN